MLYLNIECHSEIVSNINWPISFVGIELSFPCNVIPAGINLSLYVKYVILCYQSTSQEVAILMALQLCGSLHQWMCLISVELGLLQVVVQDY